MLKQPALCCEIIKLLKKTRMDDIPMCIKQIYWIISFAPTENMAGYSMQNNSLILRILHDMARNLEEGIPGWLPIDMALDMHVLHVEEKQS